MNLKRATLLLCCVLAVLLSDAAWARWRPRPQLTFDYLLGVTPRHPPANTRVIFVDGFDTSKARVARYHAQGAKAVCYINVGAWENWRPDKNKFPAKVLGRKYDGWAGERWLDIRHLDILKPIMRARLDMCKRKRFDAIDPDNVDSYQNNTGFNISRTQQLKYLNWLIRAAHKRGLSIGLKNSPGLVNALASKADFMVTEGCFREKWCHRASPFIARNKAVFAVEYKEEGMTTKKFCWRAKSQRISGILKRLNLRHWRRTCH